MPVLIVANTSDACPASPPGDAEKIAAALSRAPRQDAGTKGDRSGGGPHYIGAVAMDVSPGTSFGSD